MLDIKRLAILLIYQDGTIDSIPMRNEQIHMPYFRELRKKSLRFKTITEGLDFSQSCQYDIDAFLASIGIILMYNDNLAEMVAYPDNFGEDFEPSFVVCLPCDYASGAQKSAFYEIIRKYDKDLLYFGRYRKESDYFQEGKAVNDYVLNDELMSSSSIGERK